MFEMLSYGHTSATGGRWVGLKLRTVSCSYLILVFEAMSGAEAGS